MNIDDDKAPEGEIEKPAEPVVAPIEPVIEPAAPVAKSAEETAAEELAAKAKPAMPAKKREKDWRDDRIATLTARLKEVQEKKVEPATPDPAKPLDPTADFNRRVDEAAAQQVALKSFADRCTSEAAKGRSQWDDFDERLNDLRGLVNTSDEREVAAYNQFLQAGLETGELATLVYELGQDLGEAARIMALPPLRMGVELTKKAIAGAKIEELSRVPKPLTPVGGGRGEHVQVDPANPALADNLDIATWMKRREEQVRQQNARR